MEWSGGVGALLEGWTGNGGVAVGNGPVGSMGGVMDLEPVAMPVAEKVAVWESSPGMNVEVLW